MLRPRGEGGEGRSGGRGRNRILSMRCLMQQRGGGGGREAKKETRDLFMCLSRFLCINAASRCVFETFLACFSLGNLNPKGGNMTDHLLESVKRTWVMALSSFDHEDFSTLRCNERPLRHSSPLHLAKKNSLEFPLKILSHYFYLIF